MSGSSLTRWVLSWIRQNSSASAFPASIPVRTSLALTSINTLATPPLLIPRVLSIPMVEMLRKSRMSRPEIILNPATMVIRISIAATLKSSSPSQSKSWPNLSTDAEGTSTSSSSPAHL